MHNFLRKKYNYRYYTLNTTLIWLRRNVIQCTIKVRNDKSLGFISRSVPDRIDVKYL